MVQWVKPREPLGWRHAWGVCFQTTVWTLLVLTARCVGRGGVQFHKWINEIPTVPIYYLAKPQPRERAWQNQRGKKTLLSLTLV